MVLGFSENTPCRNTQALQGQTLHPNWLLWGKQAANLKEKREKGGACQKRKTPKRKIIPTWEKRLLHRTFLLPHTISSGVLQKSAGYLFPGDFGRSIFAGWHFRPRGYAGKLFPYPKRAGPPGEHPPLRKGQGRQMSIHRTP